MTYFEANAEKIRELAADCGSLSVFWRRTNELPPPGSKRWPDFQSCILANEALSLGFDMEHTLAVGKPSGRAMPKSDLPVVGKKRPAAKKEGTE